MFIIQITNTHSFNIHDTPTNEALFLAHGTDEATEFTNPYVSELGLKAPSISWQYWLWDEFWEMPSSYTLLHFW